MSPTIPVTAWDLAVAACLVLALAGLTWRLRVGATVPLLVAAARTTVQLLLLGWVLKAIFAQAHPLWVGLIALAMLLVAGREVLARQHLRFRGWYGYGLGTGAMFVSSFTVTALALLVLLAPQPWYDPRYAIPLLGMVLGNTMTGVSLALDRLTTEARQRAGEIEAQLLLGKTASEAIAEVRVLSLRTGLMPMINAMAAAGIVSLPGMMTGQILAGNPPMEAVKYQILIMFLITGGTGFGALVAVWWGGRQLFDARERLRLDRLA